jgi:hypothetical protein
MNSFMGLLVRDGQMDRWKSIVIVLGSGVRYAGQSMKGISRVSQIVRKRSLRNVNP